MRHLVALADWYLRGGLRDDDPAAYALVEQTVPEALKHLAAVRWAWIEFRVARAIRLAAANYADAAGKPEALAEWRARTAQGLSVALHELKPEVEILVQPSSEEVSSDAERPATVAERIGQAMDHFDAIRRTDKKLGVQEALARAVGNAFDTAHATAQRQWDWTGIPFSIGAVPVDRERSAPEWLAGHGFEAGHAERVLRYRKKGEQLKAPLGPGRGRYSSFLLDLMLGAPWRSRDE